MFRDLRPADVLAAAERIRPIVRRTRIVHSPHLAEFAHGDVWLKLENEQVTGSFKVRGAYNALASLGPRERARGVVASSAGNHGLGVAYAAHALGIRATIFVPSTAPAVKRDGIAALGATLDTSQPDYDAAMVAAKGFAAEQGAPFINPCLGDTLLAGQGTVGMEILADLPAVASIVVPVGGGGLLGGIGAIVRAVSPEVRILGAQSERTAAMALSVAAGQVVEVPVVATLADGLAGQIDAEALDIGLNALDEITTVDEAAIGRAIAWLARTHGITVEGSGAVGVAALLEGALTKVKSPVVIVVSGGNIDPAKHSAVLGQVNGN
ncbi:MAG: threonine ammonia-lyase [Gemmatimonadaceae bacterium]